MNLAELLLVRARTTPAAPALFLGDGLVADYAELARRVLTVAGGLAARGVKAGDRILLWMANSPAYIETMFGIWAAGAVVVPLNYKLHPDEVAAIVADARPRLIFADAGAPAEIGWVPVIRTGEQDLASPVAGARAAGAVPRASGDLAWIFYTSGTTGRPKGAMLSVGNLLAMAHAYVVHVDPDTARRAMLYAAPMSHGAGLYAVPQMLVGGAHVVPVSGGFDPDEILALGAGGRLAPLSLFAAPTMVRRLVEKVEEAQEPPVGIGTIVYGGGPMYSADIERAVAVMGDRFVQIYGQGETPMTITYLPRAMVSDRCHLRWRERLGSVGLPFSCMDVQVVGADGVELPCGMPGEIRVAGPTVMMGYWGDAAATAAALVDGWLHTGDIGRFDEDGLLTLTDRAKDVIISGGSNIYPREVEEVLLRHPDVEQASVIGEPDPEWGENVLAFIVARAGTGLGIAAIDAHCLDHMARFKRPKRYLFVEDLPKNAYGKVLKTELRKRLLPLS
ncbi:AMP-binding protein [Flavisphingomonas formosensis]|uniref:AMP-binding protein n=1 Tax=Flavisphingomonas formosensis TaxID=861534 RepID=UPI0012F70863|nr:AMP-binding protein [Sphingomonas formosensis]